MRLAIFALVLLSQATAAQTPGYTLQGGFGVPDGSVSCRGVAPPPVIFTRFSTCVSASGDGSLITDVFPAPAALHLWVSGFTSQAGVRIYLEDLERHRTFELRNEVEPALRWRERIWKLPAEWRGARVRMVAEDRSRKAATRLGVSLPEPASVSFAFQLARAVYRSVSLCYLALLALLPGLAFAVWLSRQRPLDAWRMIAWALTAAGLVAYASFWPYLLHPALGRAVSVAVPVVSLAALVIWLRSEISGAFREAAACFGVVTLVAVLSASAGFLYYHDDAPGEAAQVRYLPHRLPPDNILPEIVAAHLYYGESVAKIPGLIKGVHSSDRPPLQSAFFLAGYPYWQLLTKELSGYLLGIWLQCTWVAGVWVLLRRNGFGLSRIAPVILLSALSSFCMLHSFYVWPKLLSAGYCLVALACFPGSGKSWKLFDGVLAAAAVCMSLLAHPDCLFTFLAIASIQRPYPRRSILVAGAFVAAVLLVPWRLYQIYYDPTTETLAKLHLAGYVDPGLPVIGSVWYAYTHLTFGQWFFAKAQDLRVIFVGGVSEGWQERIFLSLVLAVGVLWIGLLARRQNQFAGRMLAIAVASVAIWILIMFQPGATVVHQGSFATVLLFFTALTLYLREKPYLLLSTALMQLIVFGFTVFSTGLTAGLDSGMLAVLGSTLAAGIYLSVRAATPGRATPERNSSEAPPPVEI